MNIFFLAWNPTTCAQMHCDKHVVKMILETAQILCTTHRVVDGTETMTLSKSGNRRVKRWVFDDEIKDALMYASTHVNHPSVQWARVCTEHYNWLYQLFVALCTEYTFRYHKVHLCWVKLHVVLKEAPHGLLSNDVFCAPPPAMPEHCHRGVRIDSYREYYIQEKKTFAKWSVRDAPEWFAKSLVNYV
jgi:hypothetical protein